MDSEQIRALEQKARNCRDNARAERIVAAYTGSSKAMLAAFDAIQQAGIRQARAAHFARKATVDAMKAEPGMFFNAIRPSLSTSEVIEDAKRFLVFYHNMPSWRQENRTGDLLRAKEKMVLGRFFRRFGLRLWARRAA